MSSGLRPAIDRRPAPAARTLQEPESPRHRQSPLTGSKVLRPGQHSITNRPQFAPMTSGFARLARQRTAPRFRHSRQGTCGRVGAGRHCIWSGRSKRLPTMARRTGSASRDSTTHERHTLPPSAKPNGPCSTAPMLAPAAATTASTRASQPSRALTGTSTRTPATQRPSPARSPSRRRSRRRLPASPSGSSPLAAAAAFPLQQETLAWAICG